MHLAGNVQLRQGPLPEQANPDHRQGDIGQPQGVARGDHQIQPDELAGHQEDCSPATTAAHNVDFQRPRNPVVDGVDGLRRPQHQRRPLDGVEGRRPACDRIRRVKRARIAMRRNHRPLTSHCSQRTPAPSAEVTPFSASHQLPAPTARQFD